MRDVLRAGADKVSLNTAAVAEPELVTRCARRFGSQAVVVAIDALRDRPASWTVYVKGGREATPLDAVEWASARSNSGPASCWSRRSTVTGPGSASTPSCSARSPNASGAGHRVGGAAGPADFVAAVRDGGADAVLAASIFHRSIHSIASVKAAMAGAGIAGPGHDRGRRVTVDPQYGDDGLVPAIVQDAADGRVLMLAWMDEEALNATVATGEVHFHSRSRSPLWRKGETSGNVLRLVDIAEDCDRDALLVTVDPVGPTCHRGTRSCFDPEGSSAERTTAGVRLARVAVGHDRERAATRPEGSYTAKLLAGGVDAAGRKVTEEATEVLMAAKDDAAGSTPERRAALAGESADLLYHLLVLLAERDVPPSAVLDELRRRHTE